MGTRNLPGPVSEGRILGFVVILRTCLLLHSNICSNFGGQPSKKCVNCFWYSGTVAILLCYCNIFSLKSTLYFKYWYFVVLGIRYAFYTEDGFHCLWGLFWFQLIKRMKPVLYYVSKFLCIHCVFRIQQIQDEIWWKEWKCVSAHQSYRSRRWRRVLLHCQKSVWWSHLFCFHSTRRYVI